MANIEKINLNGVEYDVKAFHDFTYTYDEVTLGAGLNTTCDPTNALPSNYQAIGITIYGDVGSRSAIPGLVVASTGRMIFHNTNTSSSVTFTPTLRVTCIEV